MNKTSKKTIIASILILAVIIAAGILLSRCDKSNSVAIPDTGPTSTPSEQAVSANADEVMGEEYPDIYERQLFVNDKVLSATDSQNGTLTIGIDENTESCNGQGLIINPTYSSSGTDNKIGYYISTSYYSEIKNSDEDYFNITSSQASQLSNLTIDWTYDELKSAEYKDASQYGVLWSFQIDDPNLTEEKIKIIVVDMNTHNFISSFTAEIIRNENGKYEFTELYDNDINSMPESKAKELCYRTTARMLLEHDRTNADTYLYSDEKTHFAPKLICLNAKFTREI
ncbi:MAG: hypothetical protein LIO53_09075 [Oscillospiraceae bacterium]|nr:hypothetical protein [Oscillospiraceae bacterium]